MFNNLRAEMVRAGFDVPKLAERVGMKPNALYSRLNGSTQLTFAEAVEIKGALGVDMPLEELFEERNNG